MSEPTSTILIVDDEPHIRCMLEFRLTRDGYDVLEASDGQKAFELAVDHRPDIVVTDFQMPGGDGLELAQKLRQEPGTSATPVILLTARGHRVSREDLDPTNIMRVVDKPFSPSDLQSLIEELLDEGRKDEAA